MTFGRKKKYKRRDELQKGNKMFCRIVSWNITSLLLAQKSNFKISSWHKQHFDPTKETQDSKG